MEDEIIKTIELEEGKSATIKKRDDQRFIEIDIPPVIQPKEIVWEMDIMGEIENLNNENENLQSKIDENNVIIKEKQALLDLMKNDK